MAFSLRNILGQRKSRSTRRRSVLRFEQLEDRTLPSTLIAVTNHRDLVFDATRDLLYITTSAGTVQRYDVVNQALLAPWTVGTSLEGADITADGSALYVTDSQTNSATNQGVLHEVNLATGAVTNLNYNLAFAESGSYDIGLASGLGLFDGRFNGSGWVPLRQVDLTSGALSTRTDDPGSGPGGQVRQDTLIHRSADRSLFFFTESNISSGPVFTYNATANTWSKAFDTNVFLDNALSAVNRNGTLIALEENGGITVMDDAFDTVKTLSGLTGGVAFDPVNDILYGVNTTGSQIVAYDTNTWTQKYTLAIGESVSAATAFGNGVMTVSGDGTLLFLATSSGVRMFNLPAPNATNHFAVSGVPMPTTAGTTSSITVTALDPQGHVLTGYTGTVHFTSTDAQAGLPADYTFTAGDQGVHTFQVTLKTAGIQSLTATDTGTASFTGTQGNIVVNPGALAGFAVTGYPSPSTAGTSQSVTVKALDAYGNTIPTYAGKVHFTSSDAQATLPADYTFTSTDRGAHSFTVTLKTAGSQSITATDAANASATGSESGISIVAAAFHGFSVTGFPSPITAGVPGNFTVTAIDSYGNLVNSYTGTVRFGCTDRQAVLPANYTFTSADKGVHGFTATLKTAYTHTITVYDAANDAYRGSQSGIVVTAAAPAAFSVTPSVSPATAGTPFKVTVNSIDAYGNFSSSYTGTVHLTSSDPQAILPADYTYTTADGGTHTFTVTLCTVATNAAGTQSITATDPATGFTGTGSVRVTPASASSLQVTTPAAVAQGSPFSVTVTALDPYGNQATGYTGTIHFTSSDGTATLPADYTFNANARGTHTFVTGVTLNVLGSESVTATDTTTGSITGSTTTTVNPEPAGLHFTVSASVSTSTAGNSFSVTVTALDGNGNVATGYTGTVVFSSSDTGSRLVLPQGYTFTAADAGVHTFTNGVILVTAGNQTVTAQDPGITDGSSAGSATVQVTPGAVAALTVSGMPNPTTAGVTGTITVTARDAYGNVAPTYTGKVHFTSSDSQAVLPADYTFTSTDAGIHSFSATLKTAGTQSITAKDTVTSGINGAQTVTVNPAAASRLGFTISNTCTAGDQLTFRVTAVDPYGNLATGYLGTVHFTSSDPQAVLPADYVFTTADAGYHTFSYAAELKTAGSQSLTVTDVANTSVNGTATIQVSPAAAATFRVTTPTSSTAGSAFSVTVTATDVYGNTTPSYTGTIHVTSSDAKAKLPADYTFTTSAGGVHTFTGGVTLYTAGGQSVTVGATGMTNGSATVQVNAAAAVSLGLTAPATSTAGSAFDFTVTAFDAYGNVATGYTGTVQFTSSDPTATLSAAYTFTTSDAGVHTFKGGATLDTAGKQTVTATDTVTSSMSASATVTVSAAAASHYQLSVPATSTAGSAFDVTLTALDPYGNTATAYAGTVHFTSTDGQATLPADYTFTGSDAGVHKFTGGVTLDTAGTQTITATDTATKTITGSGSVQVSAASAAVLGLAAPSTSTAGSAFSITVTAFDAYGNVAPTYTGTVHFTSSDARAGLPVDYTFTAGDAGSHTFTGGVTLFTAGNQSVKVTASGMTSATATVSVSPAAAASLTVNAPATSTAGSALSFTVTAYDSYGNVATGYTGTVHFTATDAQATLPADYTFTAGDAGSHSFSQAVTLDTAGKQTVTATDTATSSIAGSATVQVSPAAAKYLTVVAPAGSTAGTSFDVTTTAFDPYGNVATGYTGTVHFTSSDAHAQLPADYQFVSADQGVHTFAKGVTLDTAGSQTVTATDTASSSITGKATVSVSPAAASSFRVSAPSGSTAGSAFTTTVTAFDAFGNVATGYSGTAHFTSSDAQAVLPADSTLTSGTGSFTVTLKTAGTQSITATDTATSSITGTSNGIVVSPAAAATLQVSAPATATAGSAITVVVSARDTYGNVATGYTGTIHFTSTDGQAALPADYTFTGGDAGRHSFSVTLKTAGSQSVTATDTATSAITGTSNRVAVSPAAASSFVVAGYPSPTTAGVAHSFTVTAFDSYGNVATGYTGTVHFTSSDAQAGLPADYIFTSGDAAVHTFSATLKTAGTQSITATDTKTASITGGQSGITVNPAAASTLAVTGYPSPTTAGVTQSFTVTAFDSYGNVATGYLGTVHFTSTDAQAGLPTDYTFVGGDAGVHTFTATLKTAGTQSLTATDTKTSSITGSQSGITVNPAAASVLSVTGYPSPTTAGVAHNLVVTAFDAYGNVATGYTGTVHFTSTDAQATLPTDYTFTTGDAGVHTFSVTLKTAGSQSVTVKDTKTASIAGSQSGITVNPAAASTLAVTGYPSPTTAGVSHSFTVTALDAYGNVATGYTGTVHFTSSDAQAGLPANYTFTSGDAGVHSFTATLKTAGSQSITATDTATSSITGSQSGITVNAAAATHFVISAPTKAVSGTAFTVTVTAVDAYGNTATGYTGTVHFTSTDKRAGLPLDYTFASGDAGVHSFQVTLKSNGTQKITVTDTITSSITGSATVSVSNK